MKTHPASNMMLRAVLVAAVLGGCTSTSQPSPATSSGTPEAPQESVGSSEAAVEDAPEDVALPPRNVTVEGCADASASVVDAVEGLLVDASHRIRIAHVATLSSSRTLVLASIYRTTDGERVSSADAWLLEDGEVYALSGSANQYTNAPDARDLPDRPSAGDFWTEYSDPCSVAGIRTWNLNQ